MFGLFKNNIKMNFTQALNSSGYYAYFSKTDRRTIEKIFARVFSTEDGKKAIAYLQYITCQRALSADADAKILSFTEGQRALVGNILRIIQNGQK